MHPALHLLETAWEPVEPIVYMPRIARDPLPSHPSRPIYEPCAIGDSYFSTEVYDGASLAYGNREAGDQVWPTMQAALALEGLDGIVPYPVSQDLTADDGTTKYTGAIVQYNGDGVADPHAIYSPARRGEVPVRVLPRELPEDGHRDALRAAADRLTVGRTRTRAARCTLVGKRCFELRERFGAPDVVAREPAGANAERERFFGQLAARVRAVVVVERRERAVGRRVEESCRARTFDRGDLVGERSRGGRGVSTVVWPWRTAT